MGSDLLRAGRPSTGSRSHSGGGGPTGLGGAKFSRGTEEADRGESIAIGELRGDEGVEEGDEEAGEERGDVDDRGDSWRERGELWRGDPPRELR